MLALRVRHRQIGSSVGRGRWNSCSEMAEDTTQHSHSQLPRLLWCRGPPIPTPSLTDIPSLPDPGRLLVSRYLLLPATKNPRALPPKELSFALEEEGGGWCN